MKQTSNAQRRTSNFHMGVAFDVGCWTFSLRRSSAHSGRVAESGLRHSTRNRAWGNPPWVQIPPLPPFLVFHGEIGVERPTMMTQIGTKGRISPRITWMTGNAHLRSALAHRQARRQSDFRCFAFRWPADVNDCIRLCVATRVLRAPVRREGPPLRPPPDGCRFEERIRDLERSLCEEPRALREADALYRRLACRRFEQTLFAQPRVFPTKCKQLLVGSALDDTAMIKHENLVCVHDSGKPVRDYDGSTVEHQSLQRFLDESLRPRVHARRRFIQNQNWRILQEGPRNRKPLLFANTQLYPAPPHNAAQSVRQPIDEGTRVCHRRCLQQFFIRR